MYTKNKRGPRKDPCATPEKIDFEPETKTNTCHRVEKPQKNNTLVLRTQVNMFRLGRVWYLIVLHAGGLDFRLYDSSDLKTYLLMRW